MTLHILLKSMLVFSVLIVFFVPSLLMNAQLQPPPAAMAQQLGTPSSIDKMKKLFGVEDFIDQEGKIMSHAESEKLHGNMTAYNIFSNQRNLLVCIDNTLLSHVANDSISQDMARQAASSCDDEIVNDLTHNKTTISNSPLAPSWYSPDIGNNQTILNWAHLYLNARGIQ